MTPKSKSERKTPPKKLVRRIPQKIGSTLAKVCTPKPPTELAPLQPTQHDIVSRFLRMWAALHHIQVPPSDDASCDMLMTSILEVETRKQPRSFQKVRCIGCGAEAPFLTILGLQPGGPLTCLKCQGVEDLRARVQSRILPLKPDVWSEKVNGQRSS
jgi:hypothetical protein